MGCDRWGVAKPPSSWRCCLNFSWDTEHTLPALWLLHLSPEKSPAYSSILLMPPSPTRCTLSMPWLTPGPQVVLWCCWVKNIQLRAAPRITARFLVSRANVAYHQQNISSRVSSLKHGLLCAAGHTERASLGQQTLKSSRYLLCWLRSI